MILSFMKDTITITVQEYNVLRGTFIKAISILDSLGQAGSTIIQTKAPKPKPKETKQQRINNYKTLIETGVRVKKPEHLKK